MTFAQSVRTWWRRTTAPSKRAEAAVVASGGSSPRVPAEYLSLHTYLDHRYASIVVLTFEQMEALLGFALPAPASTERDWWAGDALHASRQASAWMGAGRKATPNLDARTVTFERVG